MEKKTIVGLVLFLLTLSVNAQSAYDKKLKSLYRNTVKTIKPNEVTALIAKGEKLVLLDTRAPEEYKVSHLKDARFLNYESYSTEDLLRLPKNEKIIVYCSVGYRSERVGEKLQKLGFKNVYNIYGGIFEWKNEGLPTFNTHNQETDSVHTYNKTWSKWLQRGVKVY